MNEIDLYRSMEAEAKANLERTLSGLKKDVKAAVSPRGWVREKPYASLLVAGSVSMALGFGAARAAKRLLAKRGATPAREDPGRKDRADLAGSKPEKDRKRSLLARAALFALREAPALALGMMRGALRDSADGAAASTADSGHNGAGMEQTEVAELLGSAMAPGAGAGEK